MALNSPTVYPDSQACSLGVKHDTCGPTIPMSDAPKCTSCLLTSRLLFSPALVRASISVSMTAALLLASQLPSWLFSQAVLTTAEVIFRLSIWMCYVACGVLVPWPGSNTSPWQWKRRVLTIRPPTNSKIIFQKQIQLNTFTYTQMQLNHSPLTLKSFGKFPMRFKIKPKVWPMVCGLLDLYAPCILGWFSS